MPLHLNCAWHLPQLAHDLVLPGFNELIPSPVVGDNFQSLLLTSSGTSHLFYCKSSLPAFPLTHFFFFFNLAAPGISYSIWEPPPGSPELGTQSLSHWNTRGPHSPICRGLTLEITTLPRNLNRPPLLEYKIRHGIHIAPSGSVNLCSTVLSPSSQPFALHILISTPLPRPLSSHLGEEVQEPSCCGLTKSVSSYLPAKVIFFISLPLHFSYLILVRMSLMLRQAFLFHSINMRVSSARHYATQRVYSTK